MVHQRLTSCYQTLRIRSTTITIVVVDLSAVDRRGDFGHQRYDRHKNRKRTDSTSGPPLSQIEGQPLSENIKKRRDELVAFARTEAAKNGGLFVDHEFGGCAVLPTSLAFCASCRTRGMRFRLCPKQGLRVAAPRHALLGLCAAFGSV
eukprot:6177955-Pleurochrysis_carterae.AAC.5